MTHMQQHSTSIIPWRYGLFLALILSALPLMLIMSWQAAIMAGFDIAAAVFIATLAHLFRHDEGKIREQARRNDANRNVMLLLTAVVSLVILVAVAVELAHKNGASGWAIALVVTTLVLAWLFSNIVYALHYAYLYYSEDGRGEDCGGLEFPKGSGALDYWDFTYFSFTLGMTFQTSDVNISSRPIRKVVLFQSFAAFVFNLGIIAFTINVLGGG
ncbi:MAG: DUF1345 domain-containing protein [Sphingobium sp.]